MEIRTTKARKILLSCNPEEDWFGHKYRMNIYRGCEHGCIYCDSRSRCYQIEDFDTITIKENTLDLLEEELGKKRIKGIIGTGSMSDPYTLSEKDLGFTRMALSLISDFCFPVHVHTKSDLILRDLDMLKKIAARTFVNVTFTITTPDDDLSMSIEPFAPCSSRRLAAMKHLAMAGIYVGVAMMPILPFIEDSEDKIAKIVELAAENGAQYIVPGFGMTLRDQQREYYFRELDRRFPGVREKYEAEFGDSYSAQCQNYRQLKNLFTQECGKRNLVCSFRDVKKWRIEIPKQNMLFET